LGAYPTSDQESSDHKKDKTSPLKAINSIVNVKAPESHKYLSLHVISQGVESSLKLGSNRGSLTPKTVTVEEQNRDMRDALL